MKFRIITRWHKQIDSKMHKFGISSYDEKKGYEARHVDFAPGRHQSGHSGNDDGYYAKHHHVRIHLHRFTASKDVPDTYARNAGTRGSICSLAPVWSPNKVMGLDILVSLFKKEKHAQSDLA
jgi:hypothetical protein